MGRFCSDGLSCSFCGKTQREVAKIIAGPKVYICSECVALCSAVLAEDETFEAERQRASDQRTLLAMQTVARHHGITEGPPLATSLPDAIRWWEGRIQRFHAERTR